MLPSHTDTDSHLIVPLLIQLPNNVTGKAAENSPTLSNKKIILKKEKTYVCVYMYLLAYLKGRVKGVEKEVFSIK